MQGEFVASDAAILDLLLERESASVAELAQAMLVTATAVRQRLMRLMAQGLVARSSSRAHRGRPSHRYKLTLQGRRKTGVNFADLAIALWRAIGELPDAELKRGLLEVISRRLADMYVDVVRGNSLEERMQSLAGLFHERRIPLTVDSRERGPVLTVLACPLRVERMRPEDVASNIREKGEDNLQEVREAWLEPNGKLSVIKQIPSKPVQKQDLRLLR